MFKKNLIGIVVVFLVFAGFYAGYMLGKGSGGAGQGMRPGMGMSQGPGQNPSRQSSGGSNPGMKSGMERPQSPGQDSSPQRPISQGQDAPQSQSGAKPSTQRPVSQGQGMPQEKPGAKPSGDAQGVKPQQGKDGAAQTSPGMKVAWAQSTETSPETPQSPENARPTERRRPGMGDGTGPQQRPQGQRPVLANQEGQREAAEVENKAMPLQQEPQGQRSMSSNPEKQEASRVQTPVQEEIPEKTQVQEQTSASGQTFYGTAVPYAEANVQSKQGGTITMLKGKEGDMVKKGEMIVRFDDRDTQLELQRAIASKKSAEQQVNQAESNFQTIQSDLKRYQQLFNDGFVSKQQVDSLQNQLTSALSSLNSAKESVKQNDVQVKMIENTLTDFRVKAPIGGLIDAKNYNVSEVYQGGGVIYHLIDIERVYVEVEIPEMYLKQIREGMTVNVFFDAVGKQPFSGSLETILPSGTADNRSFTAKVLVQNPDRAIKPGMFARIEYVSDGTSF